MHGSRNTTKHTFVEHFQGADVSKGNRSVYEALICIAQFGINMIVPIAICVALGVWIAEKTGIKFVSVILFFIGVLAGFRNCYIMAKRMIDRQEKRRNRE